MSSNRSVVDVAEADGGKVTIAQARRIHARGGWHACCWDRTRNGWDCLVCGRHLEDPDRAVAASYARKKGAA